MNPYKLREVYKQLTSQNSLLKKYLKLGTKDIKQPDLPAFVETKKCHCFFEHTNPWAVKEMFYIDDKAYFLVRVPFQGYEW